MLLTKSGTFRRYETMKALCILAAIATLTALTSATGFAIGGLYVAQLPAIGG